MRWAHADAVPSARGTPSILAMLTAACAMAFALFGANAAPAAEATDQDAYQIVKATENRVWRLNKKTGEIAVCTLDGENLVCTTSAEAITPPAKTYAEREAEKHAAETEAARQREAQKAKDLAFFDRAYQAIRSLIQAAMEHDAPEEPAAK